MSIVSNHSMPADTHTFVILTVEFTACHMAMTLYASRTSNNARIRWWEKGGKINKLILSLFIFSVEHDSIKSVAIDFLSIYIAVLHIRINHGEIIKI